MKLRNKSICFVRTDNEFNTKLFQKYCSSVGIVNEFTAPHSSYQNGTVENMNGQLERKVRLLLQGSHVPKDYWTFALKHAVYLHNNFNLNKNKSTPYELFRNSILTLPSTGDLPPFGCKVVCYNHNRKQKLFTENYVGTFLGCDNTSKVAYALLNNGKISTSSAFKTINNVFAYINKEMVSPITIDSNSSPPIL